MIFNLALIAAFGYNGHFAIGNLTMSLLSSDMQTKVTQFLLNDDADTALGKPYEGSLGRASSWADYIKRYQEYQWTKPMHYFDTDDNPPDTCLFDLKDCKSGVYGCLMSSLQHFYSNLGTDIDPTDKGPTTVITAVQGLKFFVHLMQDLHQPLHVCGKLRGGNDIQFRFGKKKANLHSIWDGLLINKRIQDDFQNMRQKWIKSMLVKAQNTTDICFGECQQLHCTTSVVDCLNTWGKWINALNCKSVWKTEPTLQSNQYTLKETDLSGEYYVNNMPLLEDLIIAAAIRTADLITKALSK